MLMMLDLSRSTWRKSSHSTSSQGQCVEVTVAAWRKSSYSASTQGNCVEVAEAAWRTSSYSMSAEGNCVEVAAPGPVAVRDSKNPDGGILAVSRRSWAAFLTTVGRGV